MSPNSQNSWMAYGVGLRLPHLAEVAATPPRLSWFEIHPENVLANPHAAELLEELARKCSISLHSVGLSVGSAAGVNTRHLGRLRSLVERVRPVFVSGHLAWSMHRNEREEYLNDLLPLLYTRESLDSVVEQVNRVQDCLGRPYLLENPASYVAFKSSTMSEAEFLAQLVRRTGCKLLCDVSNAYVSANNLNGNAWTYIDSLPAAAVAQIHLGGYTAETANSGERLLIDTHAGAIAPSAWELYRHAIRRFGPVPTLIEWDNDLPTLATLLAEAVQAEQIAAAELGTEEVVYEQVC
jgi:uncharacterized protein